MALDASCRSSASFSASGKQHKICARLTAGLSVRPAELAE